MQFGLKNPNEVRNVRRNSQRTAECFEEKIQKGKKDIYNAGFQGTFIPEVLPFRL